MLGRLGQADLASGRSERGMSEVGAHVAQADLTSGRSERGMSEVGAHVAHISSKVEQHAGPPSEESATAPQRSAEGAGAGQASGSALLEADRGRGPSVTVNQTALQRARRLSKKSIVGRAVDDSGNGGRVKQRSEAPVGGGEAASSVHEAL